LTNKHLCDIIETINDNRVTKSYSNLTNVIIWSYK